MTQQINGMVRERLINCATHFDNDQIEAIMQVVKDSGYSEMHEALREIKKLCAGAAYEQDIERQIIGGKCYLALAKAEGR